MPDELTNLSADPTLTPESTTHSDCEFPPGARELLGALFAPDDFVLIRLVETWTEPDGRKRSRTAPGGTMHLRAQELCSAPAWWRGTLDLAERERANIFFGVLPRFGGERFDLAHQMRTVRALWLDIDDCGVDEARQRLGTAGLPKPSITVCSGNGAHVYWLLDTPYLIDDVGDPVPVEVDWCRVAGKNPRDRYVIDATGTRIYQYVRDAQGQPTSTRNPDFPTLGQRARHIQDVLRALARLAGADHTHDLARLLRMPGTTNRKDERNGRSPTRCELIECDATRRYSLADFERLVEASPACQRSRAVTQVELPPAKKMTARRENLLQGFLQGLAGQEDRSKADFAFCCKAVRARFGSEDVWRVVATTSKFAERGRSYFDRTWENAVARVKEQVYNNGPGDNRPEIYLSANEHLAVEQVTDVLADDDMLFQRDSIVITPRVPPSPPRPPAHNNRRLRIHRPEGLTVLTPAAPALVRCRITAGCRLMTLNKKDEPVQAHPPGWLVPGVEAVPGAIRQIDGLLLGPTLDPDGRLVNAPGYDAQTGLYLARHVPGLEVPAEPTLADAQGCERELRELVADFPWEACGEGEGDGGERNYTRWLCLLLTAVCRHFVDRTPLGLICANTAGAGKSFLANLISLIAHGLEHPIVMSWPEGSQMQGRGDEIRKRLASLLHEGASLVLMDNLPRGMAFSSPELDAFLTADTYTDRQLGRNDGARVGGVNRCLVIATGNNVCPSGDTADRVLLVNLYTREPNPRTRPLSLYTYPDLLGHVRCERRRYLTTALTIWKAWIVAGCPRPEGQDWGSFTTWVETVVAMVRWLGLPDPLADRTTLIDEHDQERQALQTLATLWPELLGTKPLSASEIVTRLNLPGDNLGVDAERRAALREAILILCPGRNGLWPPSEKSLGRILSGFDKRVVNAADGTGKECRMQLMLCRDSHTKVNRYTVRLLDLPA
jgi:hypothetical protein